MSALIHHSLVHLICLYCWTIEILLHWRATHSIHHPWITDHVENFNGFWSCPKCMATLRLLTVDLACIQVMCSHCSCRYLMYVHSFHAVLVVSHCRCDWCRRWCWAIESGLCLQKWLFQRKLPFPSHSKDYVLKNLLILWNYLGIVLLSIIVCVVCYYCAPVVLYVWSTLVASLRGTNISYISLGCGIEGNLINVFVSWCLQMKTGFLSRMFHEKHL